MWFKRIVLRALKLDHGQNNSVVRVSVTHRAEDNGRLTKGANADITLRTLCPDGFARIDDPLQLQLGSRNSRVLEYMQHSQKVQRMGSAIEHAGKVGSGARQKRK